MLGHDTLPEYPIGGETAPPSTPTHLLAVDLPGRFSGQVTADALNRVASGGLVDDPQLRGPNLLALLGGDQDDLGNNFAHAIAINAPPNGLEALSNEFDRGVLQKMLETRNLDGKLPESCGNGDVHRKLKEMRIEGQLAPHVIAHLGSPEEFARTFNLDATQAMAARQEFAAKVSLAINYVSEGVTGHEISPEGINRFAAHSVEVAAMRHADSVGLAGEGFAGSGLHSGLGGVLGNAIGSAYFGATGAAIGAVFGNALGADLSPEITARNIAGVTFARNAYAKDHPSPAVRVVSPPGEEAKLNAGRLSGFLSAAIWPAASAITAYAGRGAEMARRLLPANLAYGFLGPGLVSHIGWQGYGSAQSRDTFIPTFCATRVDPSSNEGRYFAIDEARLQQEFRDVYLRTPARNATTHLLYEYATVANPVRQYRDVAKARQDAASRQSIASNEGHLKAIQSPPSVKGLAAGAAMYAFSGGNLPLAAAVTGGVRAGAWGLGVVTNEAFTSTRPVATPVPTTGGPPPTCLDWGGPKLGPIENVDHGRWKTAANAAHLVTRTGLGITAGLPACALQLVTCTEGGVEGTRSAWRGVKAIYDRLSAQSPPNPGLAGPQVPRGLQMV